MKTQQIFALGFAIAATLTTVFTSLSTAQLSDDATAVGTNRSIEVEQEQDAAANETSASDTVTLRGVLDPIETLRLATRDPGIIQEVMVREGDIVKAGQTIAKLDHALFAAEVSAATNELEIAKQESRNDVDLQYAKISTGVNQQVLSRSREANSRFAKSVSNTEIEKLRLEYERSRLSGLQAELQQSINQLTENLKGDQVTIAKLRLDNRTIKSQIDGTVVEVLNTPGEYVAAGQPIARILNLNRLRVICAGSARIIDPNNVPDEATFVVTINGEEVTYPAKITFISPEIDPLRQTFGVWAEIQNKDGRLRSGNVGDLKLKLK
ncbi:MAG: efflux RND transporter periplasmic adaptor subunit [Mariniblastus sp.]